MNRVANMNPERRLKKLLSDRYANMSEERRAKKKEVRAITFRLFTSLIGLSSCCGSYNLLPRMCR